MQEAFQMGSAEVMSANAPASLTGSVPVGTLEWGSFGALVDCQREDEPWCRRREVW
jgi:hypothetical protein